MSGVPISADTWLQESGIENEPSEQVAESAPALNASIKTESDPADVESRVNETVNNELSTQDNSFTSPLCNLENGQSIPCHLRTIIEDSDWEFIQKSIIAAIDLGLEKVRWQNKNTGNSGMVSVIGSNGIDECKTYQITHENKQKTRNDAVSVMVCQEEDGVYVH